jgi:hypothetical protein
MTIEERKERSRKFFERSRLNRVMDAALSKHHKSGKEKTVYVSKYGTFTITTEG